MMAIIPTHYEWNNLTDSPTNNTVIESKSKNAYYTQTLTANASYSIFTGTKGKVISTPPYVKPNQFVVITKIACSPHLNGYVQLRINDSDYFTNPDDRANLGIPGKASPYPPGAPCNCQGTQQTLPSFELNPPIYVTPGQTWNVYYTSTDGVVGDDGGVDGKSEAVAAFVKYTMFTNLDALIAMRLLDQGFAVNEKSVLNYKKQMKSII
jgi:hypothetical protein